MTTLQLIRAVEAAGGRLRVEGEFLFIAPRKVVEPFVDQLREHKTEVIILLQNRARDPEMWREDFLNWVLQSCVLRETHEDSQSVGSLLIDFAQWRAARHADAPFRETFEQLLTDSGFTITDGLALGIVLKADLEAVLSWRAQ